MERLSVDYGKKSKLEFSVYPAPQVWFDGFFVVIFGCVEDEDLIGDLLGIKS